MRWRVSSKDAPTYFGSEDSLLFQLAPTHDVFRCTEPSNKQYALMIPEEGLFFGKQDDGPVSLELDKALESGIFTQKEVGSSMQNEEGTPTAEEYVCTPDPLLFPRKEEENADGPYQPSMANASRAEKSWQIHFKILSVEVWAYDKTGPSLGFRLGNSVINQRDLGLITADPSELKGDLYELVGKDRTRSSLLCA